MRFRFLGPVRARSATAPGWVAVPADQQRVVLDRVRLTPRRTTPPRCWTSAATSTWWTI